MRKPTSVLERRLDEKQLAELMDLLCETETYKEAIPLIQERWGIKVSDSQLTRFWQRYCSPYLLASRLQSKQLADDLRSQMRSHPAAFTDAAVEQLCQMVFDLSIARERDPEALRMLFPLVLKARDQQQKAEQMAFDKEKFIAATRTKIEAGLAALAEHIKGNAEAAAAFDAYKAIVANLK